MPTYTYRGSVAADSATVFAFLADVRNLPRYLPLMSGARPLEGDDVEIEAEVNGRSHTMSAWLRADAPSRRIEWGSTTNEGYHGWLTVADDGASASIVDYALTTPREHTLEPYLRAATTFVDTALSPGS